MAKSGTSCSAQSASGQVRGYTPFVVSGEGDGGLLRDPAGMVVVEEASKEGRSNYMSKSSSEGFLGGKRGSRAGRFSRVSVSESKVGKKDQKRVSQHKESVMLKNSQMSDRSGEQDSEIEVKVTNNALFNSEAEEQPSEEETGKNEAESPPESKSSESKKKDNQTEEKEEETRKQQQQQQPEEQKDTQLRVDVKESKNDQKEAKNEQKSSDYRQVSSIDQNNEIKKIERRRIRKDHSEVVVDNAEDIFISKSFPTSSPKKQSRKSGSVDSELKVDLKPGADLRGQPIEGKRSQSSKQERQKKAKKSKIDKKKSKKLSKIEAQKSIKNRPRAFIRGRKQHNRTRNRLNRLRSRLVDPPKNSQKVEISPQKQASLSRIGVKDQRLSFDRGLGLVSRGSRLKKNSSSGVLLQNSKNYKNQLSRRGNRAQMDKRSVGGGLNLGIKLTDLASTQNFSDKDSIFPSPKRHFEGLRGELEDLAEEEDDQKSWETIENVTVVSGEKDKNPKKLEKKEGEGGQGHPKEALNNK